VVAGLAACGGGTTHHGSAAQPAPISSVIALTAEPTPGGAPFHFNTSHLNARAGRIEIRLTNAGPVGHVVRISSGRSCCMSAALKDMGGTQTVEPGQTATAFAELKPGRYFYFDPYSSFRQGFGILTVK
jgi:hypothetical protein